MGQKIVELTANQLIADMKASYPGIHARHGEEFGSSSAGSIWTGGDATMPDDSPIFGNIYDSDEYDGGVHVGFTEWIERRGWYVENHDGETFLAYPISSVMLASQAAI